MRGRDRPAPFGLPDGSALLVGALVGIFLVGALVEAEPEPDAPEFEALDGAASSWFEWSRKNAPAHAGMCNPRCQRHVCCAFGLRVLVRVLAPAVGTRVVPCALFPREPPRFPPSPNALPASQGRGARGQLWLELAMATGCGTARGRFELAMATAARGAPASSSTHVASAINRAHNAMVIDALQLRLHSWALDVDRACKVPAPGVNTACVEPCGTHQILMNNCTSSTSVL